jgi:hypothetical protein
MSQSIEEQYPYIEWKEYWQKIEWKPDSTLNEESKELLQLYHMHFTKILILAFLYLWWCNSLEFEFQIDGLARFQKLNARI